MVYKDYEDYKDYKDIITIIKIMFSPSTRDGRVRMILSMIHRKKHLLQKRPLLLSQP